MTNDTTAAEARLWLRTPHDLMDNLRSILDALATERAARVQAEGERDTAVEERDKLLRWNDPIWDCTDGAHPAWWRAHDYVSAKFKERIEVLTAERDDARRHLGDALSDAKRLADDAYTAVAEAAALREALGRDRLVMALIEANDAGHLDWTPRGIADCIIDAIAALTTPPSAAVQRVQGIVAALVELTKRAETVAEDLDEGELGPIAEAFNAAIDQALAALNGEEGEG